MSYFTNPCLHERTHAETQALLFWPFFLLFFYLSLSLVDVMCFDSCIIISRSLSSTKGTNLSQHFFQALPPNQVSCETWLPASVKTFFFPVVIKFILPIISGVWVPPIFIRMHWTFVLILNGQDFDLFYLFVVFYDYSVFCQRASTGVLKLAKLKCPFWNLQMCAGQPFLLCQQEIRSFLGNCLRTPWLRWKLSYSVLLWSGTTCTPMTTTPDASFWARSRTGSHGFGEAWEDCYWTQTASLKPTTSLCIRLEAGTEQGRRRAKVRKSHWKNVATVVRPGVTLLHHRHRHSIVFYLPGTMMLGNY